MENITFYLLKSVQFMKLDNFVPFGRSQAGTVMILIDFSLTVKAANLIFMSGRGSAISSAKQCKSGSIYNFVKLVGPRKSACIS